jgi:hypothetical protein
LNQYVYRTTATRLLNLLNEKVLGKPAEKKNYGSYGQGNGPRVKLQYMYRVCVETLGTHWVEKYHYTDKRKCRYDLSEASVGQSEIIKMP